MRHIASITAVAFALMLVGTFAAGCAQSRDVFKPWPQWAQETIERTKAGGGGDGGGTGN